MNLEEVYGVMDRPFSYELMGIDNPFNRQISKLAHMSADRLKPVTYIPRDGFSNRGEIAQRGVAAADKSIVDLGKLTPLTTITGARTLPQEISAYRSKATGNMQGAVDSFHIRNEKIMMFDYLLASNLCYVEVYTVNDRVDKFFATRNRNIAAELCGFTHAELDKYGNYLTTYRAQYEQGRINVIKLAPTSKGEVSFKASMPRNPVDLSRNARVTPVNMLDIFIDKAMTALQDKVVRFRYLKDNMQEREVVMTLSIPILTTLYGAKGAQKMLMNVNSKYDRGYVRMPEIGISKHDKTGVRALNIARLTSVEVVENIKDLDLSCIDIDFDNILPSFKNHLDSCTDNRVIGYLHQTFIGSEPSNTATVPEVKATIQNHVDVQHRLNTTTFLRDLHHFMMNNQEIYPGYDGIRREVTFGSVRDLDLGGVGAGNMFNL